MRNHGIISKLVYAGVASCLAASFTVFGCSPQATPTPTATTKPTPTPTVTATSKPTPTPTPTSANQPQYGGVLKIANRGEADALGYPATVAVTSSTVPEASTCIETLLRVGAAGNDIPWLATGVTGNVTAKTITFTLRKGVNFHDGTVFNAAAVKWNLDQFITTKSGITSSIGSVDVVDDYTVRINLTAWDSTMEVNFTQMAGMMVSPTACQANGVNWAQKHPVGTGPFKFVNWQPGVSITYQKFDGYWQQGKPYLDGVQHVFINDLTTREITLRAGEVDVAQSLLTANFTKLKGDGFTVVSRAGGIAGIALVPDSANTKSPFADVRVRQAVTYAIDNVALVKSVFGDGGAILTNQFTAPGNYAYNPSIVGYPYDPAKAKQLLTAAGYPNGFQTRLQAWNDADRVSYATGMQGYLKSVGIDAAIDILSSAQITDYQVNGKSWQGLAQAKVAGADWLSNQIAYYNGHGSYVNMLIPDDYSQALTNGISAADFTTKQKFAQEAMKLMIDKYALLVPNYVQIDSVTYKPYVHDTGLMETSSLIWAPEAAWLGKK